MRIALSDLSKTHQAQVTAQLHATPRPKTVKIEVSEPKKVVRTKRETPDATSFFVAAGLPAPVREHRFHTTRKWRFDYAFLQSRVALEVEGGIWTGGRHTSGAGFQKDMEKYNAAALAGWRVFRVTPSGLRSRLTVEMLLEAIT